MEGTGRPELWLLVADRQRARLLSGASTPHGRLHVEERAILEEEWDELQRGRPSPRTGKNGHSYASGGHEDDERIHRFAKGVASWLERELVGRRIARLHAFAAPRLLGELRGVVPGRLYERLVEHALDLAHLTPGELAVHEAVDAARRFVAPEWEVRATRGAVRRNRKKAVRAMIKDRDLAKQIVREHAAICRAIDDLRGELDRLRGEPGGEHEVGKLCGMLCMFDHHLRRHFELEEEGDFLGEAARLDPAEQRTVERLVTEHRALEKQLSALVDAAERAREGRSGLSDAFVDGLSELLTRLVEHESSENAFVQDLVIQDVGSGD